MNRILSINYISVKKKKKSLHINLQICEGYIAFLGEESIIAFIFWGRQAKNPEDHFIIRWNPVSTFVKQVIYYYFRFVTETEGQRSLMIC